MRVCYFDTGFVPGDNEGDTKRKQLILESMICTPDESEEGKELARREISNVLQKQGHADAQGPRNLGTLSYGFYHGCALRHVCRDRLRAPHDSGNGLLSISTGIGTKVELLILERLTRGLCVLQAPFPVINLSSGISDKENAPKLLSGTGEDKVYLCIVLTSDRGLCGGFNTNIIKKAKTYFQKISDEGKTLKIITVGSKGYDQLKRVYKDAIVERISFKDSKTINYLDAEKVGKMIIENFEKEEFDVCTIFYNKFKNVITQIPQEQQIIPLKTSEAEDNSSEDNYEFEPDEDEILSNLLPKNISTQIFKAMLENSASEQGSRMSAMDNATRNAGEMVDKLTIEYNRSRQAAITKELIEIISGAESL